MARGGLDGADHRVHPPGQLLPQEREEQPGEVRPAPGAPHDQVGPRVLAGHLELRQRFLPDDRLVQQSSPYCAVANASALPHCPAPVSVVSRLVPSTEL